MLFNVFQIPALVLSAVIALVSIIAWRNDFIFQRYQFSVGAIRYHKQYVRLISSAFLHANGWHLFFNLFTLYFFSSIITLVYGWLGFLLLFFGSVLAGNLFSLWLYKNRPSYAAIGASGGVSGILFAAITLSPMSSIIIFPIPIPITSWIYATLYFAYSVAMMLNPRHYDNTGHAAHLGGAACGMAFAAALTPTFVMENVLFIGIMSLPLCYLAYEILVNKRAR